MLAIAESVELIDAISEPEQRMRREYRVLPGLAVTLSQARRLWALHESACRELLDALVAEGFLRVRSDCRYVRREVCSPPLREVPACTTHGSRSLSVDRPDPTSKRLGGVHSCAGRFPHPEESCVSEPSHERAVHTTHLSRRCYASVMIPQSTPAIVRPLGSVDGPRDAR